MPMIELFLILSTILLFCELCQRITDHFDNIHGEIYQCDWYEFPMNVKRILPTILNGTQYSFVLSGIGNTEYSCEAFKKVRPSILQKLC